MDTLAHDSARVARVDAYMSRTPFIVPPQETLSRALRAMHERGIRHLVVKGRGLMGLVTAGDLEMISALPAVDPTRTPVEQVMIMAPKTVRPDTTVAKAAQLMVAEKIGCVLVVDEKNDLRGIFTTTDALKALSDQA